MPILNMVGGGKKGGNIGEPLNLTVTASGTDATITWEDNEIGTIPPTVFQKSELVRKIGSAPTSPSDGTLVVTETVKDTYKTIGYVDSGLTDGTTYYYRVFSYSDLGGISYCDAESVTISSGWQPGANTIAYYPLTSVTQGADMKGSGTAYDLSQYSHATDTVTFGTSHGVDCATFTKYASLSCTMPGIPLGKTGVTVSLWVYNNSFALQYNATFSLGDTNHHCFCNYKMSPVGLTDFGSDITSTFNCQTGQWYNLVFTIEDNSNTHNIYVNGDKKKTGDMSGYLGLSGSNFMIGGFFWGNPQEYSIDGNISNFIFEDKTWSDQEVLDYFNQTKANYGL